MDTPPEASTLAVKFFLASLTMLFGATLIGYLVTRLTSKSWGAYNIEGLRLGLVISTVIIFGISACLHLGMRAIQDAGYAALKRYLSIACLLSLLFLVSQIHNWRALLIFHGGIRTPDLSLFLFYGMTFLHALHVVGGYVPLAITTRKAWREDYGPARFRGVYNCALYWHFIDVVWVIMAVAFLIG